MNTDFSFQNFSFQPFLILASSSLPAHTHWQMGKKTKIALVVVAVLLLASGLIVHFRHPPKPARTRQIPRVTEFVGAGLQLRADGRTHGVRIEATVPGGPAAAAGITGGEFITRVDGVSLAGKTLAECASLVRGQVGSTVQLELVTSDGSQTNTVELTREKIKLQN
jgi:S1-C subfamily serine protease